MAATQKIIIDAQGQKLGRLASRIALLLRGKHLASYRPEKIADIRIVVKNCHLLALSAKKRDQKQYKRTSGYPGAVKTLLLRDAFARDPRAVLLRAIRGMLPANTHRARLLHSLQLE
ncbi:MAG: 50S ribosomal protein L13 [bacterium]